MITGSVLGDGVGLGCWPMRPAAYSPFCSCTAAEMSETVIPFCAMRSGFTHSRIE